LPEKRRTLLEKFLVLFNQAWCTEEGYILDLQEVPKEFVDIANYLQSPLLDENFRRNLEAEEQLDYIFGQQEARFLKKIAEAEKREQEAEKREQLEKFQKEEEHREKISLAVKLATYMKQNGASNAEISKETGLSPEKIIDL